MEFGEEHCHPLHPGFVRPSGRAVVHAAPAATARFFVVVSSSSSLAVAKLDEFGIRMVILIGVICCSNPLHCFLFASFAAARPATFSAFGFVIAIFSITRCATATDFLIILPVLIFG